MQITCSGASPGAQAVLGVPWPGGTIQAQSAGVDFWSALLHRLAATGSTLTEASSAQTPVSDVNPEQEVPSNRQFGKEGKEVLIAGALAVVSASPDVLPVLVSLDDGLLEAQAVLTEAPAREKLLTLMAMLSAAELVPVRVKVPSQQSCGMMVVPSTTPFGRANEGGNLELIRKASSQPPSPGACSPRGRGLEHFSDRPLVAR